MQRARPGYRWKRADRLLYDGRMKTLLISGAGAPVPGELRDVLRRGSTSLEERAARQVEPDAALSGVDRLVFWSTGDADTRDLAERSAVAERRQGREAIVFVTTDESTRIAGLSDGELFVWPRDQDRLMMAFMTGA